MKKLIVIVAAFFSIIAFAASSQATVELRELGRAPLIGPIESQGKNPFDLPEKFAGARLKISEIVKMGMSGLKYSTAKSQQIFELLELQIKSGNVNEPSLPSGTEFLWMGYESKKSGLQILRNIIWKGKKTMEGFGIAVQFEDNEIKFFIPMECGNLSLIEIKSIPRPVPSPSPPPIIELPKPEAKPEQKTELKEKEPKKEPPPALRQPEPELKPRPVEPQPELKPEPSPTPKKYYYRYYYRYRYYYQRY